MKNKEKNGTNELLGALRDYDNIRKKVKEKYDLYYEKHTSDQFKKVHKILKGYDQFYAEVNIDTTSWSMYFFSNECEYTQLALGSVINLESVVLKKFGENMHSTYFEIIIKRD